VASLQGSVEQGGQVTDNGKYDPCHSSDMVFVSVKTCYSLTGMQQCLDDGLAQG
jgi:hypothetical protein